MSKKGWVAIFIGIVAFVGIMFVGVDALMCTPPCI
jgi:hypothetical protein